MLERRARSIRFSHLSFQEFFAAVYLKERINTPNWLLGRAMAPGTTAEDLQHYADSLAWLESMVFLFELIADESARMAVRDAVFGVGQSYTIDSKCAARGTAPVLLARLADNRHVGWNVSTRAEAVDKCLGWAVSVQQWALLDDNAISVFRYLLTGEPTVISRRLSVVASFAKAISPLD